MENILTFEEWIKKYVEDADKERLEELKQLQENKDSYEGYMSGVRELLNKEYPKCAEYVRTHLVSPHRLCNRCGSHVLKSDLEQYPYQCLNCDEDMFECETHEETCAAGYQADEEISTFDYCNQIRLVAEVLCLDEIRDTDERSNTIFNLELSESDIPEFVGQIIDFFEDFLDEKGILVPNQEKRDEDPNLIAEESANIYGEDYVFLENKIKDTIINWASVNVDNFSQTKSEAHKHIIESKVQTIDDVVRRLNDGLDRTNEELEKCKKWLLEYKAANKM